MIDLKLTNEDVNELLDKLYNLGLKTKLKVAIGEKLGIILGDEEIPLSSAMQTRAFELSAHAISNRLAVEFADELLKQFRIVAEEDSRKNPGRRGGRGKSNTTAGGNHSTGGNDNVGTSSGGNSRPPPSSVEVLNDLKTFVAKNRSPFQFKGKALEDMANAVAAKGRDIQESLGLSDDQLLGLAAVSLYDIVFLCDDSGSMNMGNRIPTLVKTLQSVADWSTRLEPTGISLRFLNHENDGDGKFDNLTKLDQIKDLCYLVQFKGGSDLGAIIRKKIFKRRLLEQEQVGVNKPLIVAIITDGEPTDDDPDCFRNALRECKTSLEEGSILFILFQVCKTKECDEFVENIAEDEELEDCIYCSRTELYGMRAVLSETLTTVNEPGDANIYKTKMLDEFIKAIRSEMDSEFTNQAL